MYVCSRLRLNQRKALARGLRKTKNTRMLRKTQTQRTQLHVHQHLKHAKKNIRRKGMDNKNLHIVHK